MTGSIQNDLDWFLASICLRCEPVGSRSRRPAARHPTWLNTHLIHARNAAEAYQKAVAIGKASESHDPAPQGGRRWRFVGIWEVFAIWDDLADGEELFWEHRGRISGRSARQRCLSRRQVIRDQARPLTSKPPPRAGGARPGRKKHRAASKRVPRR
jgi:hypothetical protein